MPFRSIRVFPRSLENILHYKVLLELEQPGVYTELNPPKNP